MYTSCPGATAFKHPRATNFPAIYMGVHLTSPAYRVAARLLMAELEKSDMSESGEPVLKRARLESVVPATATAPTAETSCNATMVVRSTATSNQWSELGRSERQVSRLGWVVAGADIATNRCTALAKVF
jgi:hypothetical protein